MDGFHCLAWKRCFNSLSQHEIHCFQHHKSKDSSAQSLFCETIASSSVFWNLMAAVSSVGKEIWHKKGQKRKEVTCQLTGLHLQNHPGELRHYQWTPGVSWILQCHLFFFSLCLVLEKKATMSSGEEWRVTTPCVPEINTTTLCVWLPKKKQCHFLQNTMCFQAPCRIHSRRHINQNKHSIELYIQPLTCAHLQKCQNKRSITWNVLLTKQKQFEVIIILASGSRV